MPTSMKEGWGQAGVWNSPTGDGQDRNYVQSERANTPLHSATRSAAPKNSLNTGGTSPCSFKITLNGSQTLPSLSAWTEGDESQVDLSGRSDAKADLSGSCFRQTKAAAGAGGIFWGDRPMWAASGDKKRKKAAMKAAASAKATAKKKTSGPQLGGLTAISLHSPAEQLLLEELELGRTNESLKFGPTRGQETPDTISPASSRPSSEAGSVESGQSPSRPRTRPAHDQYSNDAFTTQNEFSTSTVGAPFQEHCNCYGSFVTDVTLLTLDSIRQQQAPHVPLNTMIARQRARSELYCGNIYKGSGGTMLGM